MGEFSTIQSSKHQDSKGHRPLAYKLLLNIDAQDLLGFSSMLYQQIASWKATKAQHWTWPAKLWALLWPWESAEQQTWAEYMARGEWLSTIQPAASSRDHWLHAIKFQSSC